MVILAYMLFILVMMLPFIIVLAIAGGWVGAQTLFASGIRSGNPLLVVLGVLLFLASTAAAWFAYKRMASWEVGEARMEKLASAPPDAAQRPRTFQLGIGFKDPIQLMLKGSIDQLSGNRRSMPMPLETDPRLRTADYLNTWFLASIADRECVARALQDGADLHPCLNYTQVPERPRLPHFGISPLNWAKGYASEVYFLDRWPSTKLYRCEVPVRKPLLPFFTRRFERGGGLSLALKRLRDCEAEALERLSIDLGTRS
jgi:hypothetical protein